MRTRTWILAWAAAIWFAPALAVPTIAPYDELPPCDSHAITLTHELGNPPPGGAFPADEAIASASTPFQFQGCTVAPPDTLDWQVLITNLTPTHWVDLFFVADADKFYGNHDGSILGGLAFRIDTAGVNAPLLSESMTADLIFEPGETWLFHVLDWDPVANAGPPSLMGSIGVGVFSAGDLGSTASIVARPLDRNVAEPAALLLLAAGLFGWRLARRSR